MALDELHERRLATVMNLLEDALDRIDLLLDGAQQGWGPDSEPPPDDDELRNLRLAANQIRGRLQAATERFEVTRTRPRWRQKLAAELSTLWVVLENARPERMKGYGREFESQDRADWESLIQHLLAEIETMRQAVAPKDDL
jgi:hypothetical protein